jgi:hypothetical protein
MNLLAYSDPLTEQPNHCIIESLNGHQIEISFRQTPTLWLEPGDTISFAYKESEPE